MAVLLAAISLLQESSLAAAGPSVAVAKNVFEHVPARSCAILCTATCSRTETYENLDINPFPLANQSFTHTTHFVTQGLIHTLSNGRQAVAAHFLTRSW